MLKAEWTDSRPRMGMETPAAPASSSPLAFFFGRANSCPKARTSNHVAQARVAVSEEPNFFPSTLSARSRRLLASSFFRSSDCTKIGLPLSNRRSRIFRSEEHTSELQSLRHL